MIKEKAREKRFRILFTLCCLALAMMAQFSCSHSGASDLNELIELNRQVVNKLPKETAKVLNAIADSIARKGNQHQETTISSLVDTTAQLLRKHQAYDELMSYVKKASPLVENVVRDTKIKHRTLIKLKTYECESNNDLGMFDRSIDSYFHILQEAKTYGLFDMQQLIYNNLGTIYSIQNRHKEALRMHIKSFEINKRHSRYCLFYNYNNIASCYRDMGRYDKTIEYRMMALHDISESKPHLYMHVKLNLVDDYSHMQEYSMAMKCIIPVKNYFEKTRNEKELPITYQRYAVVLWKTGNIAEAKNYYQKAYAMRQSCNYPDRLLIVKSYADFCAATGDKDTEIALLKYQLDLAEKSDLNTTRQAILSRLHQEELEKNDATAAYFKSIINRYQWAVGGVLLLLAALCAIAWRQHERMKKKQAATEHDRDKMHDQLTKATMNLQRVNTQLQSTRSDIAEFQKILLNKPHQEAIKALRHITARAHVTENSTNDMLVIANPNFFKKLLEKFPKLTPNDLKLCAMLRQNMTCKEIATVTGKEVRSVEVWRHRLRQKLGLTKEQDTVLFLLQF